MRPCHYKTQAPPVIYNITCGSSHLSSSFLTISAYAGDDGRGLADRCAGATNHMARHYATPNIHAPTLREGFGVHLPTPKPSPLQVEVGAREASHEVGAVDEPPVARCDGRRMRMRMHYTSTTQQPNSCNYNLIHLKSPVLHKVRKNLRRFLRADQIVE